MNLTLGGHPYNQQFAYNMKQFIKTLLREGLGDSNTKGVGDKINCEKCSHSWTIRAEDDRKYFCHNCGWDAKQQSYDKPALKKWKSENSDNLVNESAPFNFKLNKNEVNRYLSVAANDDESMAKMTYMHIVGKLYSLPDSIKLYRVIFVQSMDDINKDQLGSHYVLNERDLQGSHYIEPHSNSNGQPVVLVVKAPKDFIDFDATIINNMTYPHEKETKDKGRGVRLINVRPFEAAEFNINDY
jgi:hypothetical protein